MHTTSPTLLSQLRKPEQAGAWSRFAQLYTPLLLAWAKRQGLRDADAEDLTQEVLIKLIRLLPSYERREGESFRGWLSAITRNQCIDFQRRKATRILPPPDGLATIGAENPDPEQLADLDEREYRLRIIRGGLDAIRGDFDPASIAAFTKVMLEDQPVKEVAAELGLSPGAVYMARNRILRRLRDHLDGLLD